MLRRRASCQGSGRALRSSEFALSFGCVQGPVVACAFCGGTDMRPHAFPSTPRLVDLPAEGRVPLLRRGQSFLVPRLSGTGQRS